MVKWLLNVLLEIVDQIYLYLSVVFDGVVKFFDIIGKCDEQIMYLLVQVNQVVSILGDCSEQVDCLLVNVKILIVVFNECGCVVDVLLGNIFVFLVQV